MLICWKCRVTLWRRSSACPLDLAAWQVGFMKVAPMSLELQLPGCIRWMQKINPSAVVYCPLLNQAEAEGEGFWVARATKTWWRGSPPQWFLLLWTTFDGRMNGSATKFSLGTSHFLCKSSSFQKDVAFESCWVLTISSLQTTSFSNYSPYMSLQDAGYSADILQIPSVALLTTAGPGSMAATMRLGYGRLISWEHEIYHSNPCNGLRNSCFFFLQETIFLHHLELIKIVGRRTLLWDSMMI